MSDLKEQCYYHELARGMLDGVDAQRKVKPGLRDVGLAEAPVCRFAGCHVVVLDEEGPNGESSRLTEDRHKRVWKSPRLPTYGPR